MTTDSLLARDLMTTGVVTVPPGMPVASLAGLLAERGISAVPVTDAEGRLLGIVTEADLVHRLAGKAERAVSWLRRLLGNAESQAEDYARTHGMEARDIMTTSVITAGPDATAEECAQLMERHGIKRLPVLSEGRLAGIVSRADLLVGVLEPPERVGTPEHSRDARIRQALRAEMREQPWAQSLYVFADVKDGVVTLHGYAKSEEMRRGLRVLASRVEGVERVEDKLEVVSVPLPGEVI
ncbi:BON domain-containing protein [Roseomonas rosea]|uniref:BON domain-containing protein n=1 Tax=Muricoccus roseus TaxID=198092 RepID=A0A1M6RE93_9PROT|nr:CBS domain-containing protein [Roseomonas rosea]SHK30667.1 BON domain-containing protein [Roseomonas rosea]